jgi:flagellar basal-body rod protein FlgG
VSDAFYVGAVGLETQQRALDGIANNIANVNTHGFKRSQLRFSDVVSSHPSQDLAVTAPPDRSPGGVTLDPLFMINEQGKLERTGQAMDVAIDGAGFIELMGPGGQTLLWRGGRLAINDDGLLAGPQYLALRAGITIPADAGAIAIGSDGVVRVTLPEGPEPIEIGQIALVRVDDPSDIERLDGGLYGLPEGVTTIEAQAGEDGAGLIVQGAIEGSNVELTDEMVRLVMVQRAYAANAQIVQAADQLMAIANGLRR